MKNICKFVKRIIIFLCIVGILTPVSAQETDLKLVDVTLESGITFIHNFGDDEMSNLIESNAAGCAFFDYDGDADLDIYFVNGAYIEGISHKMGRKYKNKLSNAL